MLPRAPLRSHAEYIEFCRCLLDEAGHRCWHDLLAALGVDAEDWIRYAARHSPSPACAARTACAGLAHRVFYGSALSAACAAR